MRLLNVVMEFIAGEVASGGDWLHVQLMPMALGRDESCGGRGRGQGRGRGRGGGRGDGVEDDIEDMETSLGGEMKTWMILGLIKGRGQMEMVLEEWRCESIFWSILVRRRRRSDP